MDQQKILGYFIEEAKEYLETLEKGILELSSVVEDKEGVNEMFRAAHSIKGGAAMLGYGSIQTIAHRLEDAFKILRENKVPVDQKLESYFLKGYDVLQDLIEKLQSPFGLKPDEAEAIVESTAPTFVELQTYLNQLLAGGTTTETIENISTEARSLLKQMLALFKQQDTPKNRQNLQELCDTLARISPQEKGWQILVKTASKAIANPQHSYRILAPVVIKELKIGSDLMELNRGEDIIPSYGLEQLATAKIPQLLVSLDPKMMAATLRQVFNQQQVSQLLQLLGA
ncbi:putative CheA signal transduction histidine kinase [Rippkaea orientalis PCC 8801]|uniref:Putative CheA signal transduction histidine kinase n=1 Tax=Rippkaea orientalis (strain PCC 8801 / RF-1) TaxID=41431 RepID=B7K5V5_RIPO1|nr:Hpt domain-containing protein [Rippkaea orientalis]ACK68008.1 putative CheA signal transduction histidine kinase [Rippkaea orientalis PCC 8801]